MNSGKVAEELLEKLGYLHSKYLPCSLRHLNTLGGARARACVCVCVWGGGGGLW